MRHTITYVPTAEQHLAAARLAAPDRAAVTAAAHGLGQRPATDPLTVGESRASGVDRVEFVPPLGFAFNVAMDDTTVYVTAVWLVS